MSPNQQRCPTTDLKELRRGDHVSMLPTIIKYNGCNLQVANGAVFDYRSWKWTFRLSGSAMNKGLTHRDRNSSSSNVSDLQIVSFNWKGYWKLSLGPNFRKSLSFGWFSIPVFGNYHTTCCTPEFSLRIVWGSRCILTNSQSSWAFEVFVLRGNHENDQMISRWILVFGGAVFLLNFFFPRFFLVSSPQILLSFFEFLPVCFPFFPKAVATQWPHGVKKTRQ